MSSATAIIQARMGSSRLPGKTLARLGDLTILDWVIDRTSSASMIGDVVVATTVARDDDVVADHLSARGVRCVRGDEQDVLSRYVLAAQSATSSVLVRITADCPLVDPSLIDETVRVVEDVHGERHVDYASTGLNPDLPRGLDVEAFTTDALRTAHAQATDPAEREHVTLFIYRHPELFDCVAVSLPVWARRPDLRFTVDEQEDLVAVRRLVGDLGAQPLKLSIEDAIEHLDANPDIQRINSDVIHRNIS